MSVAARLAAFAALLGLVLLAGLGVGRAVGPVDPAGATVEHGSGEHGGGHGGSGDGEASAHGTAGPALSGLAVSDDGYTLRVAGTARPRGTQELRFVVEGPEGEPVTDYDPTHERELHLIVVRRDGTGFQHLHPDRGTDGTWSTPLTLDRAGAYRVYADFAPAGRPARTLATDLLVPGAFDPQPWPPDTDEARSGEHVVRLSGQLEAGSPSTLRFEVTRDGEPVRLDRYLGARGHLVALREGDLGYLHVHAEGDELAFEATAPTAGRYRLYLQFSVDGAVQTVDLTTTARGTGAPHEEHP